MGRDASSLRRKYDRIREMAEAERNTEKRKALTHLLDGVEPLVSRMERHYMSGYEKKHASSRISHELARASNVMKDKDYYRPMRHEGR